MARKGNGKVRGTFGQIVVDVCPDNAGRLMEKARRFSHLAKSCRRGRDRRLFYPDRGRYGCYGK